MKGKKDMHITDRLYKKKWGVYNHYLQYLQNDTENPHNLKRGHLKWNECIDSIDVDLIARQLHEIGAGYYFITLMQGDPCLIAPNETFDRIAGTLPGEACARRDLVSELYEALSPYGIDLYLYYTGDGPYKNYDIGKKFGFTEPREVGVTAQFVEKWAAVLEEYAVRYGDKVCGWWIDGCYRDFFKYTDELLTPYYDACKKGNPNAIVSMNDGVFADYKKNYVNEDFVCGEFNDFTVIPPSRFVDGAQTFMLAPLGLPCPGKEMYGGWGRYGVKHDGAYMADFVKKVNAVGGVVTVDIAVNMDGSFDKEQIKVLAEMNRILMEGRDA